VHDRLATLRTVLLEPLRTDVGNAELVVVPTGVLQTAPWSALADVPVAVSPSASTWVRAAARQAAVGSTVLVAGPGLPGAVGEIAALAGTWPDPTTLGPDESTVDAVATALRGAALVHFACHGEVRTDNPMFSGLVLRDGSLTVQEIELRELAPYRMVLAACDAAADVPYPGGEVLGFVSALLAQGTAGLVASVVEVPDAAAVGLMQALHAAARDRSLAVALHAARATADLDDPRQLVNWCGFTAFGAA
jgi:CHAT domain-containing protein